MSKERELYKDRGCRQCGQSVWTNARGLKEHARVCRFEQETDIVLTANMPNLIETGRY